MKPAAVILPGATGNGTAPSVRTETSTGMIYPFGLGLVRG